jgi:hypothetical protein
MRKVGNAVSNKLYNPDNKKPPVPIDVDEADSAMERFIRQKYIARTLSTSKRHAGARDSDDNPPPLPPKTPSRFGIRSASSIFPLGSKAKKASAHEPTSPRDSHPQPPLRNQSSQVFGVSVERDRPDGEDTERKLARLRDMGFLDDQRNAMVLKGVGGNLERAIEALVRLGEGDGRGPTLLTPARASTMPITRSLTPGANTETSRTRPISPASTNPFDMLDTPPPPPQPLSTQSTGTLQNKNPYLSTNPFGAPQQAPPSALDLAFQNMSLVPPSQPLFPHHTGGLALQQNSQMLYQQPATGPLTAPLPPATQNYAAHGYSGMTMNGGQTYLQQQTQPSMAGYNPFFPAQPQQQPQQQQLQQLQQQQQQQQPLSVNTAQFGGNLSGNPFTRSPTRIQSPTLSQIPEQIQQNFYAQPVQPQATNPFFNQMSPAAPQYPGQMQMPQQMGLAPQMTGYMQQQQQQQQPPRPDNASIMALYNNYPQPGPTQAPFQAQDGGQTTVQAPNPFFPSQTSTSQQQHQQQQQQHQQQLPQQPVQHQQHPTPVSPTTMSNNPFMNAGAAAAVQPARLVEATPKHNVSRDSMMAVGLEWSNGRHSPDAFASLSARDTR